MNIYKDLLSSKQALTHDPSIVAGYSIQKLSLERTVFGSFFFSVIPSLCVFTMVTNVTAGSTAFKRKAETNAPVYNTWFFFFLAQPHEEDKSID